VAAADRSVHVDRKAAQAQTGGAEVPLLRLPVEQGAHPDGLVFSIGPMESWWENGLAAVRLGAPLAVPLILYGLSVYLHSAQAFFETSSPSAVICVMRFWPTRMDAS